jgi:phosphoenolpyruvate carboxykinase (ATP)
MTMSTLLSFFDLTDYQLDVAEVHHNLQPSSLYEHAIRFDKDAHVAGNGALVAYSGAKTGRSPKTNAWSNTRSPRGMSGGGR